MASVFFDPAAGGDGLTVNDGSQPTPGGLGNGGHRTLFVPALNNIVNIALRVIGIATPVTNIYLPPSATDPLTKPDGSPLVNGLQYFNTTSNLFRVRKSGAWADVDVLAPVGGGGDRIFYLNDQTLTANYTIPAGKNAFAAGPITVPAGINLTAPAGTNLTIIG